MQMEKKDNVDPPGSPTNGLRCSDLGNNPVMAFSGPSDQYGKDYCLDNPECFYDKLSGLYESSGLNLILNVRETLLNLHVFYKEVTERGGYYQVTKDKRWEEVAIGMKLEGVNVKYPQQLQKVYALFLFQFEQIYFYRASEKVAADSGHIFNLGITPPMKRKSSVTLPQILVEEKDVNFRTARKMLKDKSHPVFTGGTVEQKLSPATPSKTKEMEKHSSRGRPRRIRTAYQIFIKSECERLRRTHGEKLKGQGQNFRVMADQVWRNLSESDRQPYIEESIKDKELYCQELHAQNENQNKEDPKVHSEGDYHVKPEFEKEPPAQLPDQAGVDLAVEIMNNNTPAESILQNVQDN